MRVAADAFVQVEGRRGISIGIVPGTVDGGEYRPRSGYPNRGVELAIYTHLPLSGEQGTDPLSRNHINVLTPHALVALPGGAGTAAEAALALRYGKPVILYGAAKAGLTRYLEGLDHKFRAAGLRTVCVKPGFVKTSMTEGLTPPPFAGEPDAVAEIVLRAIDRGTPVVYAPAIWQLVMLVIRNLPRAVMRRLSF